jgi:hypothetical protein
LDVLSVTLLEGGVGGRKWQWQCVSRADYSERKPKKVFSPLLSSPLLCYITTLTWGIPSKAVKDLCNLFSRLALREKRESEDPPLTARYTLFSQFEMRAFGIPPEDKPLSFIAVAGTR